MSRSRSALRPRAARPSFDPLELRSLLSTVAPTALFAGPIVPNLPNLPNASYSTVPPGALPPGGDVNPYGVAFVPGVFPTAGSTIQPGDILVSNFNNNLNEQGTGTSIVSIHPDGTQSVFFTSTQPGLSTGLGILGTGFVIVGNVPTTDGTSATVGQGTIQVLDRAGNVALTIADNQLLNGPWDLAVNDQGSQAQVFVSNVLSGTVTRINLSIPDQGDGVVVESLTQIGSGYEHRTDPAALVIGPTGLAYDAATGVLYVASTGNNVIFGIPNAGIAQRDHGLGELVYRDHAHLRGPLGLALAPNGDLLTTNGDAVHPDPTQPNELIEFTPSGQFVGELSLDPGQGAAFGLAVKGIGQRVTVATVNDDTNALDLRTIRSNAVQIVQTNLVSDVPALAPTTDPNLVNPWGMSSSPTGPIWVSNNGTGTATLYNGQGTAQPLVVTIPAAGAGQGTPTGQVFNSTSDFHLSNSQPALFLFAALDGTISGWNAGTAAEKVVTAPGAVYTGIAIARTLSGANFLYAADSTGKIDVYDAQFHLVSTAGAFPFADPNLPAGLTPYNIQNLGGTIYVTYASPTVQGGAVDAFAPRGALLRRISANVVGGPLESPWGLTLAPAGFGQFANDLLVGNKANGRISAFNPDTGVFVGQLVGSDGNQIAISGLWGLIFGNGGTGGDPNTLFFAAGIDGYTHGLFGSLTQKK